MRLDIAFRMTDHPVCSECGSVKEMSETIFREASFFFFIAFDHNHVPDRFFPVDPHLRFWTMCSYDYSSLEGVTLLKESHTSMTFDLSSLDLHGDGP
jgi:hypothetical protein